jgi:hypothetical protein
VQVLEPRLQICLCIRAPEDGELCMWCGSHAPVTARHDSDAVCYCDECIVGSRTHYIPAPRAMYNITLHVTHLNGDAGTTEMEECIGVY